MWFAVFDISMDTLIPLEGLVLNYLRQKQLRYSDNTSDKDKPDFTLYLYDGRFYLEVKEKRKPLKTSNWPILDIPERHAIIIDELTARRMFRFGIFSGVLVRDYMDELTLFPTLDLWTMPKIRTNREMAPGILKGKWIVNKQNGILCPNLDSVFLHIRDYQKNLPDYLGSSACYGEYFDEIVLPGGVPRSEEMHNLDFNSTRARGL